MKYLFTLAFFLSAQFLFAQPVTINTTLVNVGYDFVHNIPIACTQFNFDYDIEKYDLDTAKNEILVVLKKVMTNRTMGGIALIDLNTGKVKWSHKLISFDVVFTKDMYQVITENKIYCHLRENDDLLWERKTDEKYLLPSAFLTYKDKSISRIDPKTGDFLWQEKRKINPASFSNAGYLNDSTILLSASGLHTFNINNGTGWNYDLRTTEKDYSGLIVGNILGVAFGVFTGFYIISLGGPQIYHSGSGTLFDSSNIYTTSRDELICLNTKGEKQWGINYNTYIPFCKDNNGMGDDDKNANNRSRVNIGISVIYKRPNTTVLFAKGFIYKGVKQTKVRTSKAFLAGYNDTGKTIFYTSLGDEQFITETETYGDTLMIAYKDSMALYSLATGGKLAAANYQALGVKTFGQPFVARNYFTLNPDSSYTPLTQTYPGYYFGAAKDETQAVGVDPFAQKTQLVKKTDLKYQVAQVSDWHYLSAGGYNAIVVQNKKKIATITLGPKAQFYQGNIMCADDHQLTVINKEPMPH